MKFEIVKKKDVAKKRLTFGENIYCKCDDILKNDEEIIEMALQVDLSNFVLIPKEKKEDILFMKKIISKNPSSLAVCDNKDIREDGDFVADLILKEDERIVEMILPYISDELKNNKEFILLIINKVPSIYKLLNNDLLNDCDIAEQIIKYHPKVYYTLSNKTQQELQKKGVVEIEELNDAFEGKSKTAVKLLKIIYEKTQEFIEQCKKENKCYTMEDLKNKIFEWQNDDQINPTKEYIGSKVMEDKENDDIFLTCNDVSVHLFKLTEQDYKDMCKYVD